MAQLIRLGGYTSEYREFTLHRIKKPVERWRITETTTGMSYGLCDSPAQAVRYIDQLYRSKK